MAAIADRRPRLLDSSFLDALRLQIRRSQLLGFCLLSGVPTGNRLLVDTGNQGADASGLTALEVETPGSGPSTGVGSGV